MDELQQKIKDRETNLQIWYDLAIEEKNKLEAEIYERQLELKKVRERITNIEVRAIQLGYPDIL